ncbi:MAG: nuclear transport factor 2 family protein [Mucilaginibacter polytrichastri]|nr:nuclear transport factor 2 family protein [Mucilaginibacter polytrichastri]
MSYLEKAKDIYAMLEAGQLMDAFEKYYAEHVVMEELGEEPRRGKETNRKAELDFLGSVSEFHGSGVTAIAADEENKVTFVESWMDISFKDGSRVNMEQVAVQRWEDGHIVYEKFYHK